MVDWQSMIPLLYRTAVREGDTTLLQDPPPLRTHAAQTTRNWLGFLVRHEDGRVSLVCRRNKIEQLRARADAALDKTSAPALPVESTTATLSAPAAPAGEPAIPGHGTYSVRLTALDPLANRHRLNSAKLYCPTVETLADGASKTPVALSSKQMTAAPEPQLFTRLPARHTPVTPGGASKASMPMPQVSATAPSNGQTMPAVLAITPQSTTLWQTIVPPIFSSAHTTRLTSL
jgi:hypothetical protein